MIREQGQIVAAGADGCRVRVQRSSACAGCDIRRGCGTGLLARALPGATADISFPTVGGLQPGQRVEIGFPERGLLTAALVIYLLPVIALLAAAALASPWGDIAAIPAGAAGFVTALVVARRLARTMASQAHYQPVLIQGETPRPGAGDNQ